MVDRWEQIRDVLLSESLGSERPPRLRSQRTLFGIPSEVEQVMSKAGQEGTRAARERKESEARNDGDASSSSPEDPE